MINPFREKIRSADVMPLLASVLSEMAVCSGLDAPTHRWVARVLALIKTNKVNVQSFIIDYDDQVSAISKTMISLLNSKELDADQDRWYRAATVLATLWDASPDARVPNLASDYLDDISSLDELP